MEGKLLSVNKRRPEAKKSRNKQNPIPITELLEWYLRHHVGPRIFGSVLLSTKTQHVFTVSSSDTLITVSIIPGNIGNVIIPEKTNLYNSSEHSITIHSPGWFFWVQHSLIINEVIGLEMKSFAFMVCWLALFLVDFYGFCWLTSSRNGPCFLLDLHPLNFESGYHLEKRNLRRKTWPVGRFDRNQDMEGSTYMYLICSGLTCSNLLRRSQKFVWPIVENMRHQGLI